MRILNYKKVYKYDIYFADSLCHYYRHYCLHLHPRALNPAN